MINWQKTQEKYGYGSLNELKGIKRPSVICNCEKCNKTTEIKLRIKQEHVYKCPSCVNLERSDVIKERMTKKWKDTSYREKQIARKAAEDYRIIQSIAIKDK